MKLELQGREFNIEDREYYAPDIGTLWWWPGAQNIYADMRPFDPYFLRRMSVQMEPKAFVSALGKLTDFLFYNITQRHAKVEVEDEFGRPTAELKNEMSEIAVTGEMLERILQELKE